MKDWKTTLSGLALAGLNLYANGVQGKQIGLSLAMALLGHLAGDRAAVGPPKS